MRQYFRENLLFKLASTKTTGFNQIVIQETLVALSIEAAKSYTLEVVTNSS